MGKIRKVLFDDPSYHVLTFHYSLNDLKSLKLQV